MKRFTYGRMIGALLSGFLIASFAGCSTGARRLPPYHIQFQFEHAGMPLKPGEPIIARFYAQKRDRKAFCPEAPFARMPYRFLPVASEPLSWQHSDRQRLHPFVFIVKDPDGLAYRWYRFLSEEEFQEERQRWRETNGALHFSLDLADWAPSGFDWEPGRYEVTGATFVSSLMYDGVFEFGPSRFNLIEKADPETPRPEILKVELESDKTSYGIGEFITLRGYVTNTGDRSFLLQTRYPFMESRLTDLRTSDSFTGIPQETPLRYTDFTRLDPGERIQLFEERFLAGYWDPHWLLGIRREFFPGPFTGPDREIVLRLRSSGRFPEDLLPVTGIWTGMAESNVVPIHIESS